MRYLPKLLPRTADQILHLSNFFCKRKQLRRIAARYEKTDESFPATIHLAGSLFALK